MNRTDRLYAIVEELRAVSPRPRSARWLAGRLEVSTRTIERDLSALQQSGVPIWAEPGRTGGYALDAAATLRPAGLNPDEALAAIIGLGSLRHGPFRHSAATALHKLLAVMPAPDAQRAKALAARVRVLGPDAVDTTSPELATWLRAGRVLRLSYRDPQGVATRRDVEPLGTVVRDGTWYLVAWCRSRDAVRAFRGDRVVDAELTEERAPHRALGLEDLQVPLGTLRPLVDDR